MQAASTIARDAEPPLYPSTLILALTLKKIRALGVSRARITCDTDNVASARIIEKNGGVLSAKVVSARSRRLISQYWIDLSGHPTHLRADKRGI